jgi:hypothetical protein
MMERIEGCAQGQMSQGGCGKICGDEPAKWVSHSFGISECSLLIDLKDLIDPGERIQ